MPDFSPHWCPTHHRYERLCPCFPYSTLGIPLVDPPAPDYEDSRKRADETFLAMCDKEVLAPLPEWPPEVPVPEYVPPKRTATSKRISRGVEI